MPGGSGIHRPGDRSRRGIASCSAIHTPEDRSKRGHPSSLGMRSRENRSRRGIPSNPDFHSPAVGSLDNRSPDTRKQEVHRLGSRNRCRVAEVVYLRLLQKSRLHLQSPLRGPLPARHPPLLRWQHRKPLPISPHRGRVEQDHKGWCRPRGPALTQQSRTAQFGSLSLSLRPSTGLPDNGQRT